MCEMQGYHIFNAQKENRLFEGDHVHGRSIFRPKSSEELKKVITIAGRNLNKNFTKLFV